MCELRCCFSEAKFRRSAITAPNRTSPPNAPMMTMTSSLSSRRLELFGFGPSVDFKLLTQNWRLVVEIPPLARTGRGSLLEPLAPPLHDDLGSLLEPEIDPVHELPDQEDSATVVGQETVANGRVRNAAWIEPRP